MVVSGAMTSFAATSSGRETQIRQNVIINNIIKEYGVRVERFLIHDDAIIKCFIVTNSHTLNAGCDHNFRWIARKSL
jgi:hypothetical protein